METVNTADQQATNAALAALAATGNSYALAQLWELNKGLLRSMFWKWYPAHKALADAHGLTADDFEQEGFLLSSTRPRHTTQPPGRLQTG
nr:MAG TPA: RNA polymerase sigma factor [Caudoviricetes sp.]